MKNFFIVCFVLSATLSANAQVGIGINVPNASSQLDIVSTSKGVLVPRMLASERGLISTPAAGLLVFQTDGSAGFYYNAGTSGTPNWVLIQTSTNLNASSLSSGTVGTARLGSGTADNTVFLRGDNTWAAPAGGSSISMISAFTLPAGTGSFIGSPISTSSPLAVGSYNNVAMVATSALTATGISIGGNLYQGSGTDVITVTLFKNGVATAMTASITVNSAGPITSTATDIAHPITLTGGDTYAIGISHTNGTPFVRVSITLKAQ